MDSVTQKWSVYYKGRFIGYENAKSDDEARSKFIERNKDHEPQFVRVSLQNGKRVPGWAAFSR